MCVILVQKKTFLTLHALSKVSGMPRPGEPTYRCPDCNDLLLRTEFSSHPDVCTQTQRVPINRKYEEVKFEQNNVDIDDIDLFYKPQFAIEENSHRKEANPRTLELKSKPRKRISKQYPTFRKCSNDIVCTICENKFNSKKRFRRHVDINHRDFPCDECRQYFPWKCEQCLKHTDRFCDICSKVFNTSAEKTSHLSIHLGLAPYKPFLCEICTKSFARKDHAIAHNKIHLSQRIIKETKTSEAWQSPCVECGILFTKPYTNCVDHNKQVQEINYPCEKGCGYVSKWKREIQKHYNSSRCNIEKPLLRIFLCSFCDKSFTTAKYQQRHEKFHTEGPKYECKECNIKFCESWGLKRHMKRFHDLV